MGIRTICIFVETPFLKRAYKRYGVETMQERGFTVRIFDCSPFLLPSAYNSVRNDLCDYDALGIIRCASADKAYREILTFDAEHTLCIIDINYSEISLKIYQALKRKEIPFCYFLLDIGPTPSIAQRGRTYLRSLSWKRIKASTFVRFPKWILGVRCADFVVASGTEGLAPYMKSRACNKNTQILFLHGMDFEDCREIENSPGIVKEPYAVCIDQYHPYHPDRERYNVHFDPDTYYQQLNAFIGHIEQWFSMPVIIAEHPRSDYDIHPEAYGTRKRIKNQTAILVRDCAFAFTINSTSVNYALIFDKPFLLITMDEFERQPLYAAAHATFSQSLDKTMLNISGDDASNENLVRFSLHKDERKRLEYIRKYIKGDYEDTLKCPSFSDIFCNYIEKFKSPR